MKKEILFVGLVLLSILGLFFHKFFFFGLIPFPGDLLIHDYAPWKYESFLGYNPGSYPTKYQYFDVLRQMYPWKTFVIESIRNGQIPLWNPYNFSGAPLLANVQSQVFTPFNILYLIFPFKFSWSIALILQTALSFFFTYLYARFIKLKREAAIFSALAFSCCLYMSVFFEYGVFGQTILWLPMVLLGIESFLKKFSLQSVFLLVFSITFAAFGGHLQIFSSILLFAFLYAVVRLFSIKENKVKKAGGLVFSVCIALGIAAIQLLPTIELIGLSARAPHDPKFFFEILLLQFKELIVIISPDFYGNPANNNFLLSKSYPQTAMYIGIIPFIFALSALRGKKENLQWFFIGAVVFILTAITNNPISHIVYSLKIPLLSSSAPTNMIFLMSFSLSILAGYGLDQWLTKKHKYPLSVALFLGGVLTLVAVWYHVLQIPFSVKNTLYSAALIGIFVVFYLFSKLIKNKNIFVYLLIFITIFDLFYFFQKFNPFVPSSLVFPQTKITTDVSKHSGSERMWGFGYANILANTNMVFRSSSPEGYDPLYPKLYGEFVSLSDDGKFSQSFTMNTRSNAMIDTALGFASEHKEAQKVLNILGVGFILDRVENGSTEQTFPESNYTISYKENGWMIYQSTTAAKRAFLTSDYRVYRSNNEFEKIFSSDDFDPQTMILLEKNPSFPAKQDGLAENVKIEIYEPNNIVFTVSSNEQKLLFLSDTYYPGWYAFVDGKQTEILRANYSFRAVEIPAGEHKVQFVYKPKSFFIGSSIALFSFSILFIVGCTQYVRKLRYE